MWPADLTRHAINQLREKRPDITVEDFADLPNAPKPSGFKLTLPGGQVAWVQTTTSSPTTSGEAQISWETPAAAQ